MAQVVKNPIVGQKIGKLMLIKIEEKLGGNNRIRKEIICNCDCGATVVMPIGEFGNRRSCGCARNHELHWMAHTKVWAAWQRMKRRCNNPKDKKYRIYGAVGRFVCEGLHDFKHFYKIIGDPISKNHSLDRTDNEKNYTCGVCNQCNENGYSLNIRWATPKEQSNNVSTNFMVTYNGVKMTLANACREAGLSYKAVFSRIKNCGWDISKALTTPIGKPHSYKKL